MILSWYGSVIDIEAQKQALERTKRVAETLQEAFLPRQLPQRADLRLDAIYVSAEKDALVGGDWYDAFELPDGKLGFSIGDVTGHGLEASIAVGKLRQAIFTLALRIDDPAEILVEVDRILRSPSAGNVRNRTRRVHRPRRNDDALRDGRTSTPAHRLPGRRTGDRLSKRRPAARRRRPPDPVDARDSDSQGYGAGAVYRRDDGIRSRRHRRRREIASRDTDAGRKHVDRAAGQRRLRARPERRRHPRTTRHSCCSSSRKLNRRRCNPTTGTKKQWRFHASDAQAAHVARRDFQPTSSGYAAKPNRRMRAS